jgi:hypothetical protein
MNLNRTIAGRVARLNGYNRENVEIRLLKTNICRTKNICKYHLQNNGINNIRTCNINNIIPFKVSDLIKDTNYNHFKNECKKNNIECCKPPHDKPPSDIILLFTYMGKPYIIKYDIKKSKSTSTQLCSKQFDLLIENFDIDNKDINNMKKYLEYNNKTRTWIKLEEKKEIIKSVVTILNHIKKKWILDRWCPELYHNNYIMKDDVMINIKNILNKELTFELGKTNIVFKLDGIKFISIKPYGSSNSNRIQLHIYKDIFKHKDAVNISNMV